MTLYVGGTSLLLHGNGADGSTVFTDETGKTVTPYGNARISTAQSKFGGSSMYFDGVGDYASVPYSDAFDISASDFTLEAWVFNTQAIGTSKALVGRWKSPYSFLLYTLPSGKIAAQFGPSNVVILTSTSNFAQNTWQHIACTRHGYVFTLWIDGVPESVVSYTGVLGNSGGSLLVGQIYDGVVYGVGDYGWGGYIDDLRIIKGVALYTANFTPPTAPLEITSGTQIQIQAHDPGITKLAKYDPSQIKPVISEVKDDLQDRWPYGPWTTPAVLFEFKGRGVITGTVAEKALPANTPLRRLVRLHREPDGAFVKAVWSDAVTGNYTFNGVRADHKYFVTSFDYTGTYRAVIADNLVPTPL